MYVRHCTVECRGAYEAKERHRASGGAIVEEALIEDGEEGVQDGAIRLEDLINEGDCRIWEVALYLPDVLILFERSH